MGIVSAAGTGLQEVSTLLARPGVGLGQGLGTGGRDLKKEVGGIMMLVALQALPEDPATPVLVLVSKPPAKAVVQVVLTQSSASTKPTVICFLGGDTRTLERPPMSSLQNFAGMSFLAAKAVHPEIGDIQAISRMKTRLPGAARHGTQGQASTPQQRYFRGLFFGGTLCYEAR